MQIVHAKEWGNELGFREFMRIKHKYSRRSGVNYLVYMKYLKR